MNNNYSIFNLFITLEFKTPFSDLKLSPVGKTIKVKNRFIVTNGQAIAQSIFWIVNPIQIHQKHVINNLNQIFKMD